VSDRELEVVVARVTGVSGVAGVNLFRRDGNQWRMVPRSGAQHPVSLPLEKWQLPELLSVVVLADGGPVPTDLRGAPNPFAGRGGDGSGADGGAGGGVAVAVPVVPEVC
jgi:hypothetical protein